MEANSELQMVLTWVSGHSKIEGNEIVDTEAKNMYLGRRFHYWYYRDIFKSREHGA